MAKDRIARDELVDKLLETATSAEDPLRAMAEMVADFVMEAEVAAKVGAAPYERSDESIHAPQRQPGQALGHATGHAMAKVPKPMSSC